MIWQVVSGTNCQVFRTCSFTTPFVAAVCFVVFADCKPPQIPLSKPIHFTRRQRAVGSEVTESSVASVV